MKKISPYLALALGVFVLVTVSFRAGLFTGLEYFFEDLLFSPRPISPDVVILAIDEESLERLGQWPWSRETFAKIISKFEASPPAALAIDVIFADPSSLGPADDLSLQKALQAASYPVLLPVEAVPLWLDGGNPRAAKLIEPLKLFQTGGKVGLGHVNVVQDSDGVVRSFPPKIHADGRIFNHLAYEALKSAREPIPREEELAGVERIFYSAAAGSVRRIPVWRALEDDSLPSLGGKVVFLGATAADLHDEKPTPLTKGRAMSGVEIQAQVANMLLQGYRLRPAPAAANISWFFLAAFLPLLTFLFWKGSLKPVFASVILGVFYLFLIAALFELGAVFNLLHISFSWVLSTASLFSYRYFIGEREKREIKHLFSKYVSKDVLEEILKEPAQVRLGGEEREVTVLFSDIRDFTKLSEKRSPQELVRILNKYLSAMTEEILAEDGVLDKYIGDAIMAFWGAPLAEPKAEDKALQAAIRMTKRLKILNKEFRKAGDPELNIGIGIYTGPAVVGNMGSELRFDYTVIGDTVNAASRLESATKEYKVKIILGESTKNKIKGEYKFKFLGAATVKGKEIPINVYTLGEDIQNQLFP